MGQPDGTLALALLLSCQAATILVAVRYCALMGFRNCRLQAFKRPQKIRKGCAAAPRSHLGNSHLVLSGFDTAVCRPSKRQKRPQRLRSGCWEPFGPQPSGFIGFRDCRLPAFKKPKQAAHAAQRLLGTFGPQPSGLMGFRDCHLPAFKRPKKGRKGYAAAPRSHVGHSHLVLWGFKTAVC